MSDEDAWLAHHRRNERGRPISLWSKSHFKYSPHGSSATLTPRAPISQPRIGATTSLTPPGDSLDARADPDPETPAETHSNKDHLVCVFQHLEDKFTRQNTCFFPLPPPSIATIKKAREARDRAAAAKQKQ